MSVSEVTGWQTNAACLRAALAYAKLGIEVLPVHSIHEGACTCGDPGCVSPGKHPLLSNGFHGATTHAPTIEAWWQRHTFANVGARPRTIGLVIDVDPRNGGEDAYDRWVNSHGVPQDTVTTFTGGAGRHYWFRAEAVQNQKCDGEFAGIDIISATGYVLMPPSIHISGSQYNWEASTELIENDEAGLGVAEAMRLFASIPVGWKRALRKPAEPVERAAPQSLVDPPPEEMDRVRQALVQISPDRYDDWLHVGMALHSACWLGAFELWDVWSQRSEKYPSVGELQKKWDSFSINGDIGLGSIFHAAGEAATLQSPARLTDPRADVLHHELLMSLPELCKHIKKGDELIDGAIGADALVQLFGPAGMGKTFIALSIALAVAAGKPWAGRAVSQAPVVYVNGEGRQGLGRRVKAWLISNRLEPASVPFFITQRSLALTLEEQTEALIAAVLSVNAKLVVVDTLARNFAGDENSTADMSVFVSQMERLQRETGATAIVVHHTGHATTERARGSIALHAAVDVEFRVLRDGNLICLTNTKQRDIEQLDELFFESEVVEFSDDDGNEISSLVVNATDNKPVELELLSGGQQTVLDLIHTMQDETRARLDDMGKGSEPASVSRRELAKRLPELSSGALRKTIQRLQSTNRITSTRSEVRAIRGGILTGQTTGQTTGQ